MDAILVSACLLGEPVRYDGSAVPCHHPVLDRLRSEGRLVPFCPEVAAGLPTPRPPVELVGGDGAELIHGRAHALEASGRDQTAAFRAAADAALSLCRQQNIRVAVLKDRSPSCGNRWIHDGTFSGAVVPGQGVVAAALKEAGIRIFTETQWEDLDRHLSGEDL